MNLILMKYPNSQLKIDLVVVYLYTYLQYYSNKNT